MSIHLLECAALQRLPAATKLALMAHADSADRHTHISLPGLDQVMTWSGLGRSQASAVVADLVAAGYLRKHKAGRRGHRAEYVVFPEGCCAEHPRPPAETIDTTPAPSSTDLGSGPPESVSGTGSGPPDPNGVVLHNPATNPNLGSGPPDPDTLIGSGLGPAHRTPSLTTRTTPQPPGKPGGARCTRHPNGPGPSCRTCGTTPRQLADAQARAAAEQRRRHEQAAARAATEAARAAATDTEATRARVAHLRAIKHTGRDTA